MSRLFVYSRTVSQLRRFLRDGTYERIGEEQARTTDVRIVAATNRKLAGEAARKRFHQGGQGMAKRTE